MSFTLWFMGRPAAGKTTLATRVEQRLRDRGGRVENLDGDEVRQHLHPDLGFTREERATNNRRTAYICKLLNRHDVTVVNAMISPFRDARARAREVIEQEGEFLLVYVKCSLAECERRDPKGLYAQARAGDLERFTGVNHPFQEPEAPDITVDTEANSVEACVADVLTSLEDRGLVAEQESTV